MLLGAGLCLVLLPVSVLEPRTTARAVLFAWLYWIGLAAGAMVLLMAHVLTGGDWGIRARPVLRNAARALFILAGPFIVILLTLRLVYPWTVNSGGPPFSDVTRLYLNPLGFTIRGIAILAVWGAFGLAAGASRSLSPLRAGIGLGLYLLTVTVAAVDWLASLVPQWSSSAYGMLIGASQVTTAIAFAALMTSGEEGGHAVGDIAGLLLAAILGMTYLGFMQFLVVWSSGLPDKTVWYELRQQPHAVALIAAAFLIGVVTPFLMLLRTDVRTDAVRTGVAGFLVLIGLALFWAWHIIPGGAAQALWIYPLAFFAIGAVWLGIAFGPLGSEGGAQTGVASHA
jgi:hypothetical protein